MLCTRLDIFFAVDLVSFYQSNQGLADRQAVNRVKCYLRGVANLVFCYQGRDPNLIIYSNVNCGGDPDETRSTLGHAFTLGGGAMSWCTKKQTYTKCWLQRQIVCLVTIETKSIIIRYIYSNKVIMFP